jgi:hypothetical protein
MTGSGRSLTFLNLSEFVSPGIYLYLPEDVFANV